MVDGDSMDTHIVRVSADRPLDATCDCQDFKRHGRLCKHGGAALIHAGKWFFAAALANMNAASRAAAASRAEEEKEDAARSTSGN